MSSATTSAPPACCGRKDGQGCVCRNEATCSCGKKSAGACDCEKKSEENAVKGATCSCGMLLCCVVLCSAMIVLSEIGSAMIIQYCNGWDVVESLCVT